MDKNDGAASLVRSDALLATAISEWISAVTVVLQHVPMPHDVRSRLERLATTIQQIANK